MPKWFFVYALVIVMGTIALSPLLWGEIVASLLVTSLGLILPLYLYLVFVKK